MDNGISINHAACLNNRQVLLSFAPGSFSSACANEVTAQSITVPRASEASLGGTIRQCFALARKNASKQASTHARKHVAGSGKQILSRDKCDKLDA